MGMYDSFYIDCPVCGHELEYQSKSGPCVLACFGKKPKKGDSIWTCEHLTADVAIDLQGDVVRCQFCNSRIQLSIDIPEVVKVKAKSLGKRAKYNYNGNHNPKHPDSIKRYKAMEKLFKKTAKTKKELKKMGVKL